MRSAAISIALALFGVCVADAHKPVTSKYTYWEDVYPIVREHCGGCHVTGGIAPMSLLTYEDARPWAESIRLELTTGHMPPWYGEPSVAPLRDDRKLSPRDLDVILTWVTGGTPPGTPPRLSAAFARRTWSRGRPDVTVTVPETESLPAGTSEDTREFVLRDGDRDRVIASADLLPGNPAIVHDAIVFTRRSGSEEPAAVIATWIPGDAAPAPPAGLGFNWRAGEQLVVRIHYKKNWKLENKAASDRSTVGLYFAKSAATRALRSVAMEAGTATTTVEPIRAIAVRASGVEADTRIDVDAVRPDGSHLAVAAFAARPGWSQRYWLARAIDLPAGSRLDAKASSERVQPIRVWLDVLP